SGHRGRSSAHPFGLALVSIEPLGQRLPHQFTQGPVQPDRAEHRALVQRDGHDDGCGDGVLATLEARTFRGPEYASAAYSNQPILTEIRRYFAIPSLEGYTALTDGVCTEDGRAGIERMYT